MPEKDIRAVLGRFLFVQEEVKKVINDLSGGEKARLQLALLMLERNNVLILDEPTNHLDIDSKEMLEQALSGFEGTIIFVSHDRYFIDQLANKVFDLDTSGGSLYLGDYQYYVEKLEEKEALAEHRKQGSTSSEPQETAATSNTYQDQKQRRKEQRQIERQINEYEETITKCETEIELLDEQLTQPDIFSDPEKAAEIAEQKSQIEHTLEEAMINWEELQEKLD